MTRSHFYELARAPTLACAALASALSGCSAQVDGAYQGEPLATIRGTVTSTRGALASDRPVVAAVLWYLEPSPGEVEPKFIGERVAVRGSFPASFTLDIYNPPPRSAEMRTTFEFEQEGASIPIGTPLGVWTGFVAALDARAKDDDIQKEDILGIDTSHTLIYLDAPIGRLDPAGAFDPEDVLRLLRHQKVHTYEIQETEGFHLAKRNPANQRGISKLYECNWAEICVQWSDPAQQDFFDWDFQRCTERFPQNPTCSASFEPTPDEPATSSACRAQAAGRDAEAGVCLEAATAWLNGEGGDEDSRNAANRYMENPTGLADPITIEMGTTLYDL